MLLRGQVAGPGVSCERKQLAGPGRTVAPVAVEIGKPELLMRLMEFPDFKGERQVSSAPVLPSSREARPSRSRVNGGTPARITLAGVLLLRGQAVGPGVSCERKQLAGPGRTVAPVAVEIGKPER
ncbi:MAG TPA: hypothetical protein DCK78_18775 [Paenibacillus lactis]|nr:hypothetical protein [Paenibacillus lactis]